MGVGGKKGARILTFIRALWASEGDPRPDRYLTLQVTA